MFIDVAKALAAIQAAPKLTRRIGNVMAGMRDAFALSGYEVGAPYIFDFFDTMQGTSTRSLTFAQPATAFVRSFGFYCQDVEVAPLDEFADIQLIELAIGTVKYYESQGDQPNQPWFAEPENLLNSDTGTTHGPMLPFQTDGFARWFLVGQDDLWRCTFRNNGADRFNVGVRFECYSPKITQDTDE